MSLQTDGSEGAVTAPLIAWVEKILGGRVVRCERQPRWRLAYYLDVERDGTREAFYFRGARRPGSTDWLIREGELLNLVESHGVPAPHYFGYCENPEGILLAGLSGHAVFQDASEAEQEVLAEEFLTALARWHAIPAQEIVDLGFAMPKSSREHHLMDLDELERAYRSSITADSPPAPLVEFTVRWLRSNVPDHRGPSVLVQGDTGPGQFLFDRGHITGIIDWELAKFGDPMYDLACIRGRDLSYPFGDFPARLRRYAELSGNALDLDLLRFYSVRTMIITPIGIYPLFASGRLSAVDMVTYVAWNIVYGRAMTQTLAEAIGLTLDEVPFLDGADTPRSWLHQTLISGLQDVVLPAQSDPMNTYRVGALAQLAGHLSLADRLGAAVDAAKLDDAAEILGRRPISPLEADAQVQALVLASGPERDADLIRYFYRDYVRQERLLGPLLGPLAETASLSPLI